MMLGTKMNLAAERLVSQRAGGGVDLLTGLSGRKQTLGPGGVCIQHTAGLPGPQRCWRCLPCTSATPLLRRSGAEGVLLRHS